LIRSLWNLTAVDPGFRAEQLVAARVAPPGFADASDATKMQFAASLLERLRATPGMESAGLANAVPFDVGLFGNVFEIEGKERQGAATNYAQTFIGITPDYLETMGTPLVEGRAFTAADRAGSTRVAIVSRSLARLNWGDESPLGKRIRFQDNRQPREGDVLFPWFTIVGVADDVKFGGLGSKTGPMLYIPLEQHWDITSLRVVIRSGEDPERVAAALRAVVSSLDRNTPVSDFRTFEARLADTIARPRFTAYLLGSFAGIAIFLAAIGVYGVLSYAMSRRTAEIGVRMAFGAGDREVFGLLFGQGIRLTLIGVAIGIPLALGATRLLSSLLFGVDALDFQVFAGVAIALLAVGLAASYWPARRAARIDPMEALRQE
jgi:putative ABC transport system permease protein